MSSISIQAARATYGGSTIEETVIRMTAAINCTKVYIYANDFGDQRTPTDFYRIERPDDEERLRSSPTVHHPQLIYSNGAFIREPEPTGRRWRPRKSWISLSVRWSYRWKHDRLIILAVALLALAWGCISLSFIREEFALAARFSLPAPPITWAMMLGNVATAFGAILVLSLFTGPVAYFTWKKLLDERPGSGWLTYAALNLGLGLFFLST